MRKRDTRTRGAQHAHGERGADKQGWAERTASIGALNVGMGGGAPPGGGGGRDDGGAGGRDDGGAGGASPATADQTEARLLADKKHGRIQLAADALQGLLSA